MSQTAHDESHNTEQCRSLLPVTEKKYIILKVVYRN